MAAGLLIAELMSKSAKKGMKSSGDAGKAEDVLKRIKNKERAYEEGEDSDEMEDDVEDPIDLFIEAMGGTPSEEARKAFKLAVQSCYEEELQAMPSTVSQSALRTRIRTVVRQPNVNGFISDAEVNRLINDAAYELYDLLIAARGELYYTIEWAFNTDPNRRRYILPTRFYRLVGANITQQAGVSTGEVPLSSEPEVVVPANAAWVELPRMNLAEWSKQDSLYGCSYSRLKYTLTGLGNNSGNIQKAELALYPVPSSIHCINLLYIPVLDLSNAPASGEPVYDGVNGWEDYIVYSVASVIAGMQEESNDLWLAKKAELRDRIKTLAPTRDRVQPTQVADRWDDSPWDEYPWRRGWP